MTTAISYANDNQFVRVYALTASSVNACLVNEFSGLDILGSHERASQNRDTFVFQWLTRLVLHRQISNLDVHFLRWEDIVIS